MVTQIWVDIGSGNGLVPDGTKPLPKPVLIYNQWGSMTFPFQLLSHVFKISFCNLTRLKTTLVKLLLHLPGANELRNVWAIICEFKVWTMIYHCYCIHYGVMVDHVITLFNMAGHTSFCLNFKAEFMQISISVNSCSDCNGKIDIINSPG